MFKVTLLSALSLQAFGCGTNDGASLDDIVEVGRFGFDAGQPRVHVPDSGLVGTDVVVSITTVGDGCVSFESTDIAIAADGFDVTPFDRRRQPGPDEGCITLEKQIAHDVALSFDTPGPATIRVHGRTFNAEGEQFVELPFSIAIE